MSRVIRRRADGHLSGPEEPPGAPGPGEVRLLQRAAGAGRADREPGDAGFPEAPDAPGLSAMGVADAVGPGVADVAPGDRLAYAGVPGAWREVRILPAGRLVPVPDDIDDATAAGALLPGLAAHYLLRRLRRVAPGEKILVHAAAGALGRFLCRWAATLGAEVTGTVRPGAAAPRVPGVARILAWGHGAAAEALELTGGVDAVYDPVGRDSFPASLDCLAPRGTAVALGTLSGPVGAIAPSRLQACSHVLARPALAHWIADPAELAAAAAEVFEMIGADRADPGSVRILPVPAAGGVLPVIGSGPAALIF